MHGADRLFRVIDSHMVEVGFRVLFIVLSLALAVAMIW